MATKALSLFLIWLLLLGALLGPGATRVVQAQSGDPGDPPQASASTSGGTRVVTDDDVNRVAKQLYCPVCPNTPLDVCETKACEDWRAQIREQLSAGWSDQQVIDYFVAQYGERVLAEPQRKGFTSLVWLLPLLAVIGGLLFAWQLLRSWRLRRQAVPVPATAPPGPEVAPEVLARIEEELRELR